MWRDDDLAYTIAMTDAYLTTSPIDCTSDSDALCDAVNEFNRRIDLEFDIFKMILDMDVFGFAAFELLQRFRPNAKWNEHV